MLNRLNRVVAGCLVGATLAGGTLFCVVPAFAADSWPCHNVAASIGSSGGHLVGTGTWNCIAGYTGNSFTTEVHVYHYYSLLPDADVFYGQWSLIGSTANQSRSTTRCDQSTTAEYYAQARIPSFATATINSGRKVITTCAGTGN